MVAQTRLINQVIFFLSLVVTWVDACIQHMVEYSSMIIITWWSTNNLHEIFYRFDQSAMWNAPNINLYVNVNTKESFKCLTSQSRGRVGVRGFDYLLSAWRDITVCVFVQNVAMVLSFILIIVGWSFVTLLVIKELLQENTKCMIYKA